MTVQTLLETVSFYGDVVDAPAFASNFDYAIGRVTIAKGGIGETRVVNEGQRESSEIQDHYDVIIPCDGTMSFCQRTGEARWSPANTCF